MGAPLVKCFTEDALEQPAVGVEASGQLQRVVKPDGPRLKVGLADPPKLMVKAPVVVGVQVQMTKPEVP